MNRRRHAERLAARVLEDVGAEPPKVDPREIAKRLGARVVGIEAGDDQSSGMVARDKGRIFIGVNESHAEVRQRFTIAHEIGHMLLHASDPLIVDKDFAVIGHRRSDGTSDIREVEANAFAAALLMPEEWVRDAVRLVDLDVSVDSSMAELAERFGVSQQAMTYRLINLGVLRNI